MADKEWNTFNPGERVRMRPLITTGVVMEMSRRHIVKILLDDGSIVWDGIGQFELEPPPSSKGGG